MARGAANGVGFARVTRVKGRVEGTCACGIGGIDLDVRPGKGLEEEPLHELREANRLVFDFTRNTLRVDPLPKLRLGLDKYKRWKLSGNIRRPSEDNGCDVQGCWLSIYGHFAACEMIRLATKHPTEDKKTQPEPAAASQAEMFAVHLTPLLEGDDSKRGFNHARYLSLAATLHFILQSTTHLISVPSCNCGFPNADVDQVALYDYPSLNHLHLMVTPNQGRVVVVAVYGGVASL
jgi:hypothetical protein